MTKAGVPLLTWASTSTRRGSRPTSACVTARASTLRRYGAKVYDFVPSSSGDARDEHVFEVLARTPSGAAVHMTAQALVEAQPRTGEDLGIEVAPVVDDDEHGRTGSE